MNQEASLLASSSSSSLAKKMTDFVNYLRRTSVDEEAFCFGYLIEYIYIWYFNTQA